MSRRRFRRRDITKTTTAGRLARIVAVEVPVQGHRRQPRVLADGADAEAGDRALTALVVAVEQVDAERLAVRDGVAGDEEQRILDVADRALPEAGLTGRDVDVACQPSVGRGV